MDRDKKILREIEKTLDEKFLKDIKLEASKMRVKAKLKKLREDKESALQAKEKLRKRFEEILNDRDYESAYCADDQIIIDFHDGHREIHLIEPRNKNGEEE